MNNKQLIEYLFNYKMCKTTKINKDDMSKYPDENICKTYDESIYLCELDEYTNTRILLGIFKCVNTIKNILVTGIALGIVGIILSLFIGK